MGVQRASCKYPQRPELSPGDDLVTQGANPRVVALGALGPIPTPTGHTRIGSISDHIID